MLIGARNVEAVLRPEKCADTNLPYSCKGYDHHLDPLTYYGIAHRLTFSQGTNAIKPPSLLP